MTEFNEIDDRLENYPSWPIEALKEVAEAETLTALKLTLALDVLCTTYEAWLTSREIAEKLDITFEEWKNVPRQLGRMAKSWGFELPKTTLDYPDMTQEAYPIVPLEEFHTGYDSMSWGVSHETRKLWNTIRGVGSQAALR